MAHHLRVHIKTINADDYDGAIYKKVDIYDVNTRSGERYRVMLPKSLVFYSIYIPSPGYNIPSTYFLSVFQWKFWIAVMILLFLLLTFIKLYSNVHKKSFGDYVQHVFHKFGISTENVDDLTLAMKIALITLSIFAICFSASFSGLLVTNFSLSNEVLPFKSLDEFLIQKEYFMCFRRNSMPELYLDARKSTNIRFNHPDCSRYTARNTAEAIKILKISLCKNSKLAYFEIVPKMRYLARISKKYITARLLFSTASNVIEINTLRNFFISDFVD